MKKIRIVLCLLLCTCLFTACGGTGKDNPAQTTQPTQPQSAGNPLPEENKMVASVGLRGVSPSAAADGYYICTNVVQFCTADSVSPITLCSQMGCAHEDSTCQAWIGEVQQFSEYMGKLYAIVLSEDATQFVEKDLTTGAITTIDMWENQPGKYYYVSMGKTADQITILYVTQTTTTTQNDRTVTKDEESVWRYNLQTGESRMLFSGKQASQLGVMAVSSRYLAVICGKGNPNLLTKAEFEAQYGENASYDRYLSRSELVELRLYNADASVCTVVASTERDGMVATGDPASAYGKEVVYQCNDTIYLLNVDTGESRAVVTMENIINYWVMDHKVFLIASNLPWYIASDPNKEIGIYCADFDDGIPVKLGNGGNTQGMEFSVSEEGTSYFIGIYHDGKYIISKEDFYADRYENALLLY